MKNDWKLDDPAMILRTGGGYTKGTIIAIYEDRARVCFPVGKTYQGNVNTDLPEDTPAYKTIELTALLTEEEYQRLNAAPKEES